MTVPGIAILLVIAVNVGHMTVELMALTVAALSWMYPTRTIRSQVLSIRERPYVAVARANGASELQVVFREIMPNLLPFIAASFVGAVSAAMLASIGLEALGLGANDVHTLGTTIYWAQKYSAVLRGQWWWFGPPIAMIATIFIGLFFVSVGHGPVRQPAPAAADMSVQMARAGPRRRGEARATRLPAVLQVEDLQVHYQTPRGPVKAVDGVSFALRPGERLGPDRRVRLGQDDDGHRADAADPAAGTDRRRAACSSTAATCSRSRRAAAARRPAARDRAGAAGRDELAQSGHAHRRPDHRRHRRPRGRDRRAPTGRSASRRRLARVGLPVASPIATRTS